MGSCGACPFCQRRTIFTAFPSSSRISAGVYGEMRPVILLTGGSGQVVGELLPLLSQLGEVVAPDHSQLDLSKPAGVRRTIREVRPQLIINAAAYTAVDRAETDEATAQMVNAEAPEVMAVEAKKIGAVLLHFSTDYVFDGTKRTPYDETDSA